MAAENDSTPLVPLHLDTAVGSNGIEQDSFRLPPDIPLLDSSILQKLQQELRRLDAEYRAELDRLQAEAGKKAGPVWDAASHFHFVKLCKEYQHHSRALLLDR